MLHLTLQRKVLTENVTIGTLSLGGYVLCYTLEDKVRPKGVKVPGATAIPAGYYRGRCTLSERFQLVLPLLLNVPGFDGIRIHSGNTEKDTRGCILVGQTTDWKTRVSGSRAALSALLEELKPHGGNFDLEIVDAKVQG